MELRILAVDRDEKISRKEEQEWEKHGISVIRADSMSEAVKTLSRKEYEFLFVAINADTVAFMPQLKIMRDATPAFIFVITSDFTTEKEVNTLDGGADLYVRWRDSKENVMSALALVRRFEERRGRGDKQTILVHGDLLLNLYTSEVFINDKNINATKTEFEILHCLIMNSGHIVTRQILFHNIWGERPDEPSRDVIWNHIKRLRKKMNLSSGHNDYIETVKGLGYRISAIKTIK